MAKVAKAAERTWEFYRERPDCFAAHAAQRSGGHIRDYSHNIGINPAGIATRALRHDRLATIPNHSAPAFHAGDLGDHISQCVAAANSCRVNQTSAVGVHFKNLDTI